MLGSIYFNSFMWSELTSYKGKKREGKKKHWSSLEPIISYMLESGK